MPKSEEYFPEEERSRQPSIFSVIRAIVRTFHSEGDPQLGLYGAFGAFGWHSCLCLSSPVDVMYVPLLTPQLNI